MSGRISSITTLRAKELGIDSVYQGVNDKLALYEELKLMDAWNDAEVAFIGDDINDIELMKKLVYPQQQTILLIM